MSALLLQTGPGVFEVLASVCHSHQEALKQFVENSADAIQQLCVEEGRISIQLEYEELKSESTTKALKNIVVSDNGIGMSRDKMLFVLEHIGDSEKLQLSLRGEKGIGLLAFSLIAEELHLASSPNEGVPSSCLVLKRSWLKKGQAEIIARCPRHTHSQRGTYAHLENILSEAADKFSKERLKGYLGREFASDLRRGLYAMSVSDDHNPELVPPQRYRGTRAMDCLLPLGKLGSASIELHVLPWEMADATVSLYGRGGARICFLTDLDEFKNQPWTDKRVEGHIRFDSLNRTADKAAVVQDQVYQALAVELRKLEKQIQEMINSVSITTQERRFEQITHKTSRLIDRFLRYRDRGLLEELEARARGPKTEERKTLTAGVPATGVERLPRPGHPRPIDVRVPGIALHSPPQERSLARSWYDPSSGSICINREHPEFMLSQREDARCVRYLFTIWVKESLLQEYGTDAERLADEMVGLLAEAEPLLW